MSSMIRTVVPAPVSAPRGSAWCGAAAAQVLKQAHELGAAVQQAWRKRHRGSGSLVVSKSHG